MSDQSAKSNVVAGPWRQLQLEPVSTDPAAAVACTIKLYQMQVNALCDVLESLSRSGGDVNVQSTLNICLAMTGLPFRVEAKGN